MTLAQAVNTTANAVPVNPASSLGLSPTHIVIGVVLLAIIVIAIYAFATKDGYYYKNSRLSGIKGGKVRRVITEYDETDDDSETIV